ncbi:MAG TPA: GspH/FimT family pseudopilin [Pirellulales bacterium]|nr:GspH/FimT family pseudopilin [Pirellulales bacterium]
MPSRRPSSAAFSLVELLIVIAVMGIVAALTLPSVNSGIHEQLQSTADAIAGDLAYARGLAVANNSTYRFSFDLANNQFTLRYSGANPSLATLPPNPFQSGSNTDPTQYVIRLNDMPSLGGKVQLVAVGTMGNRPASTTTLEFGPLGGTTSADPTVIWLSSGAGAAQRFISVSVNPVTGLAGVNPFGASGPPASVLQ